MPDAHVAGPVTDLRVNAGDGHVVVTTGGDGGVTIHRVVRYQHGTPHPGQRLSDGTLTFSAGCSRCRVDYDLVVPASVRVWARTDSGQINLTGVSAADAGTVTKMQPTSNARVPIRSCMRRVCHTSCTTCSKEALVHSCGRSAPRLGVKA